MTLSLSSELETAIQAVAEAARLAGALQGGLSARFLEKSDLSPVTIADFAVQALVARRLHGAFPELAIVGEESPAMLLQPENAASLTGVVEAVRRVLPRASAEEVVAWIGLGAKSPQERFWTLDPIDGTKGFIRGGQFVVALALIERGRVELGVLGCPKLSVQGDRLEFVTEMGRGSLVVARRGHGAWARPLVSDEGDFTRLRVSTRARPEDAILLHSVEPSHMSLEGLNRFKQVFASQQSAIPLDSQAKYAAIAGGLGDLMIRFPSASRPGTEEKIWDYAAGAIVVEEAGGRVTDLDGKALDFGRGATLSGNRGVLVSNGLLHAQALQSSRSIPS